jgi:hypothetical protein
MDMRLSAAFFRRTRGYQPRFFDVEETRLPAACPGLAQSDEYFSLSDGTK